MDLPRREKLHYLELVRGLSALAVCGFHVRHYMFGDWAAHHGSNILWRAFFLLTSFGHQAVIVFFLLSGLVIYKSVSDERASSYAIDWVAYAWRRFSRLWIVLIPALILTATWDFIGHNWFDSDFYSGSVGPISVAPYYRTEIAGYSILAFLGNILFLQTIIVPTFGTNGPLWSLANEAFYYALFPFLTLLAGVRKTRTPIVVASVVVVVAALVVCPPSISLYGIIWLFGALAFHLGLRVSWHPVVRRVFLGAALAVFAMTLVAEKVANFEGVTADFILGAAFFPVLLPLVTMYPKSNVLLELGAKLSKFSFTLYVVHLPFFGLLWSVALRGARLPLNLFGITAYTVVVAVVLAYAYGVYLLFEKHTGGLQRLVMRRISKPKL